MNCPNCNAVLEDDVKFCHSCGASVEIPTTTEPTLEPKVIEKPFIPDNYQPLSPWAYFWLNILFAVPVVGFVFLIVFSFSKGNINRRNFARSYWCLWIIFAIIAVIIIALAIALYATSGVSFNDISSNSMSYL